MTHEDWNSSLADAIGIFLNGAAMPSVDHRGEPIVDDSFLLLLNPSASTIDWVLPGPPMGERWVVELSSDDLLSSALIRERTVEVLARSATVLRRIA